MASNDPNPREEQPPASGHPADSVKEQLAARRASINDDIEETLWEGGYSPKAMVGSWILCGILTVAAIVGALIVGTFPVWVAIVAAAVVWAIVALVYLYRRMGVQYELTTQRFLHQTGVLSRRTDRIEVIDIDDVIYEQGPIQRIFGIGTIRIESSDRSHPTLSLPGIANVKHVAGLIDDIRRKERRKRSLHIEAV